MGVTVIDDRFYNSNCLQLNNHLNYHSFIHSCIRISWNTTNQFLAQLNGSCLPMTLSGIRHLLKNTYEAFNRSLYNQVIIIIIISLTKNL